MTEELADRELQAMHTCVRALEPLTPDQRARALAAVCLVLDLPPDRPLATERMVLARRTPRPQEAP